MLKTIKVPDGVKIAVVGDIHEHNDQFDQMVNKLNPTEKLWLVSVGDIYDKGFGFDKAELICQKMAEMTKQRIAFAIRGNHELKHLRKLQKSNEDLPPGLVWCQTLPLTLLFEFVNGTKLTIVHGGVSPKHTWDDLSNNVETCYIRSVDENGNMIRLVWRIVDGKNVLEAEKPNGINWHDIYDGRFGYIAAGHNAQKDGLAKFYAYSCNLDTAVYHTGILTAQIFGESGREELVSVSGLAKQPQLDIA